MKNQYITIGDKTLIFCNNGREVVIDTSDLDLVSSINGTWTVSKTGPTPRSPYYAYWKTTRNNKQVATYMHRLITSAPTGMDVDHVDRDGLNNCRSNLRVCTTKQNVSRRIVFNEPGRNSTTGVRNVYKASATSYRVTICGITFGYFRTLAEAAQVAERERTYINTLRAA